MMDSTTTNSARPGPRGLPLWALLGVSVATTGPTMAMAGNPQAIVGSVGKGVPLVLILGFIGVSLVAYAFYTLTRHMNHAGSAYALVGSTVGPRAGFFSGFAMGGAYLLLTICTFPIFAAFTNSFLAQVQVGDQEPFQLPWIVPAVVLMAISGFLAGRETKRIAQVLIVIEAIGILAMIVLAGVIFARGGAPATGIDFSAFSLSGGTQPSAIIAATVIAFFSWVGFEACAALGEESDNPRRNVPLALAGTVALLGLLYIVVIFAQTVGFGTDAAGLAAMQGSGNTLGDLGAAYVGTAFSLLIVFTAAISALAANLACASASSRLIFAFARDGFGPRPLAAIDEGTRSPRTALLLVLAVSAAVNVLSWATGWPDMATGDRAIDTYVFFAIAATVALLVSYLMVEVAAIAFVVSLGRERTTRSLVIAVVLLALGSLLIVAVLWQSLKDQTDPLSSPAYWGLLWCAVGLVLAMSLKGLARRIGDSLASELAANDSDGELVQRPGEGSIGAPVEARTELR